MDLILNVAADVEPQEYPAAIFGLLLLFFIWFAIVSIIFLVAACRAAKAHKTIADAVQRAVKAHESAAWSLHTIAGSHEQAGGQGPSPRNI